MQRKFTSTHRHARVGANDTCEKVEQTTWVHQVAQAIEEQLETDEQELMMREQRKKAKDAKRISSVVHDSDRKKGTSRARAEMVQRMRHDEQKLQTAQSVGRLASGPLQAGGLTSTTVVTTHVRESSQGNALARNTERVHQDRIGGDLQRTTRETERAREVGWYKTHARPELYGSTPPLDAL